MSLLEVRDLHVWFAMEGRGELHAVRGVSFELDPGDALGMVGESGCGKTTALLAVLGLLPPSAAVTGRVSFAGEDLLVDRDEVARRHRWRSIATVFQGTMSALNPVKTAGAQIREPMELHGIASGRAADRRVAQLLELVGMAAGIASRYPHELSGGMRQRVSIAMALACEPQVLLADEPTTGLDVMVQAQVLDLLSRLAREAGLALVLVTHDLALVAQVCRRALVMRAGEIVERGQLEALYHAPRHPYTRMLFAATPDLDADAGRASISSTPPAPDRPARSADAEAARDEDAALLDVRNLSARYAVRRRLWATVQREPRQFVHAADGVSFSVPPGGMLALVGESGCGKTTTAHAALRLLDPESGSVRFAGGEITHASQRSLRTLRRRMQLVYQDPYEALDPRFRVRQTVEEPLLVHERGLSTAQRRDRVVAALSRAELTPPQQYLERYPHELSGGQRQRVAIAASLILDPQLLVADEPVSMLDVSARAGVLSLLDSLRRDGRMGILMITHDLSTAARYADRLAVMYLGRIVEEGPAWEVVSRPAHPYTRALISVIPASDPRRRHQPQPLRGEPPDPRSVPTGCRFRSRCPLAQDECAAVDPELRSVASASGGEHRAACIFAEAPRR
jgi:peptide/nickel transport system ATP-binding protein